MTTEELKKHIETIIDNTFKAIDEVYKTNKENSKPAKYNSDNSLIFPIYKNGKHPEGLRVSEQELRCIFIEEFNKNCRGYYYSIETPTCMRYSFSNSGKKTTPKCYSEKKGRSGCIDLVIHNKDGRRAALIEFKKAPCDPHEYAKDFLKLFAENEGEERFFICISEEKSGVSPLEDIEKKICEDYFNFNNNVDEAAKNIKKEHPLHFYSHKLGNNGNYETCSISFKNGECKIERHTFSSK